MDRRDFLALSATFTLSVPLATKALSMENFESNALAALDAAMQKQVADGKVPGITWLLAKGGDVAFGAAGTFEFGGGGALMARDTIFRIASMSKPVGATAVMMLVEDGKVDLAADVETYLPELANRRVLTALDAPLDSTVPAERPIKVRDLLTFTMGFGIQFDPTLPIQQAITELKLANDYPLPPTPHTPDEWLDRFATLPLMAQPGSTWMYNTGSILQTVLIQRVSGQPADAFIQERVLDPLGMVDTGFWVPEEKLHRLPPYYGMNWETMEVRLEDPADGMWSKPPAFPSVAGGMVSTVDDFLAFARMLMNKGAHNGTQLLKPETVAEMTRDQLTPEQKKGAGFTPDFFDALGWGYGMGVSTAPSAIADNVGRYGWDGGFGLSWANDPVSGLIGMMMTQNSGFYAAAPFADFWVPANAALAS
jgi:CubicO group peptidase (beta-lactamase class C family)